MLTQIAFCGLDCMECPAFHAEERLTLDERQKIADQWKVEFGSESTAEEIDCSGCTATEGRMVPFCAVCEIRQCRLARSVSTCASCAEFGCERLAAFWVNAPAARANLEALRPA